MAKDEKEALKKFPNLPKFVFVSEPRDFYSPINGKLIKKSEIDLVARVITGGKLRKIFPVTSGIATEVATCIPGTILAEVMGNSIKKEEFFEKEKRIRIGHPSGGYWSSKEIKDVIELRIALEVFAVKLAIQRILPNEINELKILIAKMEKAVKKVDMMKASHLNSLFHDKIILASKNKELFEVMEPIKNKIHHFRIISIFTPNRLEGSLKEHKAIFNALKNKDDKSAQRLMAKHIQEVGSIIEKKIKEKEGIK